MYKCILTWCKKQANTEEHFTNLVQKKGYRRPNRMSHGRMIRSERHLITDGRALASGLSLANTWPFWIQMLQIFFSRSSFLASKNRSDVLFVRCSEPKIFPPWRRSCYYLMTLLRYYLQQKQLKLVTNWHFDSNDVCENKYVMSVKS